MSTAQIEKNGILAFENFLSKSKVLRAEIPVNDKTPSWDGHIYAYEAENKNDKKDNLKGRIPVQVKSTKIKKEEESFSLEVADLNNYLRDGGIIFLRPTYKSTTDCVIFYKLLLPVTIKEILDRANAKQKMISVKLEKIDNLKSFESICKYFLLNRPLQSNPENFIDIKTLINQNPEIISIMFGDSKKPEAMFDDKTYFYHSPYEGVKIPCLIKMQKLRLKRNLQVTVNDKVFFKNVVSTKMRDGTGYLELNPALKIEIDEKDQVASFETDFSEHILFKECLVALRFYKALSTAKEFTIGDIKTSYASVDNNKLLNEKFELFENSEKVFELFRIDKDELTLGALNQHIPMIDKFLSLFVNRDEIHVDSDKDLFIKRSYFINKTVLVLFKKSKESYYTAYNFLIEDPFESGFMVIYEDESIESSKYLGLETVEDVKAIDSYFDEVFKDLFDLYNPRNTSNYELFMLNCISAYDETRKLDFLDLAEKLLLLMSEKENGNSPELISSTNFINKMQIFKRKRTLEKDEKQQLFSLKEKFKDDLQRVCCINLLLESYDEFEILFNKLNEEQQAKFRSWPIVNLYPNKLKIQ